MGASAAASRMEVARDAGATLTLKKSAGVLADIRLYNCAVDPEEAALLAGLPPDAYLPTPPPLRLWVDWTRATGRSVVYATAPAATAKLDLTCRETTGNKVVRTASVTNFPAGLAEALVTADAPFPTGGYRYEGIAYDKTGTEIGRVQSAPWTQEKIDWPWFQCNIGLDHTIILPPFTPLTLAGRTLSTVTTDLTLDKSGFFSSIVTGGGQLLHGSISLQADSGGKPLVFTGAGLAPIARQDHAARWTSTLTSPEGHTLRVAGELEYDGVTRFDITIIPNGTLSLDSVALRIPYQPEIAKLAHLGTSHSFFAIDKATTGETSLHSINWAHLDPKRVRRPGVVLDAQDFAKTLFPPPMRTWYFPYLHVGNYHRGLSWFLDDDRGWVHDPANVSPTELVAEGTDIYSRLNLIAKPTTLTAPWTVRVYLLANPFKPLPPNWRTWSVADWRHANDMGKHSQYVFEWHWNEYAQSFCPYPGGGISGKYEDWVGRFTKDSVRHTPFINFGSPGGFPLYGDQETAVTPYDWKLHTTRPLQDYMIYWFNKCAHEIGVKGTYIDEPYVEPFSYNILAGDTPSIREDGTRDIGFRYMEGRDYIRRFKTLFTGLGIDYSIWMHTTNYKVLPVFTFADISMDGEHPQIWVREFDDYFGFYNAEMSRGYISGFSTGLVGTQMYHSTTDPTKGSDAIIDRFSRLYFKGRSYLAVTLPYGVLPQVGSEVCNDELDRTQNIRYAFGMFDDGIRELPWNDAAACPTGWRVEPAGLWLSGDLNPAHNRALLYGSSPSGNPTTNFTLTEVGPTQVHAWDAETGVSLRVDNSFRVEKAPGDFTMLWLEGRGTPQASRPNGAILGVSFDNGIAADFGAGIRPVGILPAGNPAPDLPPGKAGAALALSSNGGALSYPLVPSWLQGSAEFDLQVTNLGNAKCQLLALAHQLDATLSLGKDDDGKPALLLAALETPAGAGAKAKPQRYTASAPLPEGHDWMHVILSWQCGHYTLYLNGKRASGISVPAMPAIRDSQALAYGVTVGKPTANDDAAPTTALLDSLLLYDWPLRAADAVTARKPLQPAVRPAPATTFPVWLFDSGKDVKLALNYRGCAEWGKVNQVRITAANKSKPATPFAQVSFHPWLGMGITQLKSGAAPAEAPDDVDVGSHGEAPTPAGDAGSQDEGWILKIELLNGKDVVLSRTLTVNENKGSVAGEY